MGVITNLLCPGAMFIRVPVVNSVGGQTRYLLPVALPYLSQEIAFKTQICAFCLPMKHTNDQFHFVTSRYTLWELKMGCFTCTVCTARQMHSFTEYLYRSSKYVVKNNSILYLVELHYLNSKMVSWINSKTWGKSRKSRTSIAKVWKRVNQY